MKPLVALLTVITFSAFSMNAQDFQFEKSTDEVKKVKATIQALGDNMVAVTEDEDSKRYFLTNLPDEYKVDGLKVMFNGILGIIPPNIRMVGNPVKLTKIKACPGYEEMGVETKSFTFED